MNKIFKSNLFYKILSVVLAIILWAFVLYTVKPKINKEIHDVEVTFAGVETLKKQDLIIYEHEPFKVDVTLNGARTEIARIDSGDIDAIISVENIISAGEYALIPKISVSTNAVSVISSEPTTTRIKVENLEHRRMPIKINQMNALPDPNTILDPILFTNEIIVSGPESVINVIEEIVVDLDLSKVKNGEELIKEYKILDKYGIEVKNDGNIGVNFDMARITCNIYHTREMPVYPIVEGTPHPIYAIESIVVSPQTVVLAGGKEIIEALSNVSTVPININGITQDVALKAELDLPETAFVYAENSSKQEIIVTVNVGKKVTEKIPITYLQAENENDQNRFILEDDDLMISIVGTENNVKNADVRASIDISKLDIGQHKVPINIITTGPYVEVKGSYFANITILN